MSSHPAPRFSLPLRLHRPAPPLARQRRRRSLAAALLIATVALLGPRTLRAQAEDAPNGNPTGSTGDFNGEVTTGGSYDPFTGNAKRAITDLVVPGTAGAYPLAFSRVSNSRQTATDPRENVCFGDGANWRHSYQWFIYPLGLDNQDPRQPVWMVVYPDGSTTKFKRGRQSAPPNEPYLRGPAGTSDRLETNDPANPGYFVLHTSDGGQVHFRGGIGLGDFGANFVPDSITDPFNQTTWIEYDSASSRVTKVTEPAGHSLQFYYDTYSYNGRPWVVLSKVRGYTPYGAVTSDVGYAYDFYGSDGQNPYLVLTHVFYYSEASARPGDVVTAFYYPGPYNASVPGGKPLLLNCYDPHYAGPMANIRYTFSGDPNLAWGTVASEGRAVPGQPTVDAEVVSTLIGPGGDPGETRGDGPHRDFHYGQDSTQIGTTNAKPYQLTSASDFQGGWTYYAYNAQGYRQSARDPKGNVTGFDTEPLTGKPTAIHNPDGTTRTFAYTDSNQPYYLLSVTDERGQRTTYNRDGNHLVRSIDYPDGSHEYFDYEDVNIGWGVFHRPTRHVTRRGAVISFFYGDGNRTALPTQITRPHANNNDGNYDSTFLAYDNADRVRTTSDSRPGGPVETTDYDGFHRARRVTHADGSYVELGRDDYGNVLTRRDELGHVTTTYYDDYRRPYYVQAPVDQAAGIYRVTQFNYDRFGQNNSAYRHTTPNPGGLYLPSGRAIGMLYSENWWPVERIDANGAADQSITYFGYDANGNRSAVNQQVGPNAWRQTNSDYDARNRLSHTSEPNGAVTTYGYDLAGNLARVDLPPDPNPRTILYADPGDPNNVGNVINYDPMNRRRWTQDPKGQTVSMAYDAGGQLNRLTDANGYTDFAYDLLGRKKQTVYLDGTVERWAYDASGNVATFQNRAGVLQTMRPYDSRNHPSGWDWSDGTTAAGGFVYDAAGRMTVADSWDSHVAFTYNDAGEVTSEFQNVGYRGELTVSYDRDPAGRIVGMRYPSGGYFRFGYTGREQLASVSLDGSGTLASYDYKADGARRWRTLLNGTVTDSDHYDQAGRLTLTNDVQVNTNPNHTITARTYGYTPTHKLSWMVKYAESNNPDENGRGNAYLYDAADQLQTAYLDAVNVQSAVDGNGNSYAGPLGDPHRFGDYRYDAAGNRTYANETNAVATYTADGLNRLSGFGYDALGDLTAYPGGAQAGNWNYAYDAQGRLKSVSGTDRQGVGHSGVFYYDALGRCVARYLDGVSAYLYYDLAGNVIEERDDATNFRFAFVHGPGADELVCRLGSGPTLWYHQDALGDVAALSDDVGNVLERYAYDAFGAPYVRDGAGWPCAGNQSAYGNRQLAKGRDWLGEVGLYDYRAPLPA